MTVDKTMATKRTGHIYCNKGRVAWHREREHSRNDTETRCLGCWGSSTRWWSYRKKREFQRVGVTGNQWQRTSHSQRQLNSLNRHWSRRAGRNPDEGHEQGMFRIFFGDIRTHLVWTEDDYVEPKTVYEAKQGNNWDQWHRAMKDEVKALQDNETWNLLIPPTDRDVIPGKWVYKVKLGPRGQVDKYKVRSVTKGFKQVYGLDYFVTFAPTCKPAIFRILLQLSAKHCHVMHQFDVKTVFLHSPIEEEEYLEQPQEIGKQRWDGEKLVCWLYNSICGLRQTANNWYKKTGKFHTETRVLQKQEQSLLVRESRDRGPHLHLGLGWRHHSCIKKHDSYLWCQKSTCGKNSHGRQREITLVSGSKN